MTFSIRFPLRNLPGFDRLSQRTIREKKPVSKTSKRTEFQSENKIRKKTTILLALRTVSREFA
ncbi:hypothetical protein DLM75_15825 [Leptospira stimsonii]|uniref:Uncharacterized protein n=1 Tax=Leptospira stimsonii TaxID=2202203 RepID=A0A396Z6I5_9LEPT|nr:hypothetical protein DLM75_15825 [Leptospira stimsonii]